MTSLKNYTGSVNDNFTVLNEHTGVARAYDHNKQDTGEAQGRDALPPDEVIWPELRKGNDTAFIVLYNRYFDFLIQYGYQFTRDPELIKDAVQDLFVDIRVKRSSLPVIRSSVKFFLLKSLKNKILQYIRKDQRFRKNILASHEFEFSPELSVEYQLISNQRTHEQKEKLMMAIEKLSAREKEALYYLFYQRLDYAQIKELMALNNIKSARNLVYKSIGKLKTAFKVFMVLATISLH